MLLNGGELDQVRLLSPRTVSFMTSDHLWPGVAFSPVTLNLFEPLGIAPMPKVGQGFGLGFVATARSRIEALAIEQAAFQIEADRVPGLEARVSALGNDTAELKALLGRARFPRNQRSYASQRA